MFVYYKYIKMTVFNCNKYVNGIATQLYINFIVNTLNLTFNVKYECAIYYND